MNFFNIQKALKLKKQNNWEKIYVAIDLHDTIIAGSCNPAFDANNRFVFFANAEECLRYLSERTDVCLILFCASSEIHINDFLKVCWSKNIIFKYINHNPECETGSHTTTSDFSTKFYYNILLDDRAGFEGDKDWKQVLQTFQYAKDALSDSVEIIDNYGNIFTWWIKKIS